MTRRKQRKFFPVSRSRSLGYELLESRRVLSAPTVTAVAFNTLGVDPPDLDGVPQPTSWQQQGSDIRDIVVTFSEEMDLSVSDLVLTSLGLNPDADADTVFNLSSADFSLTGNQLTLSFPFFELPDGIPEGVYQLEILPTATSACANARARTSGAMLGSP